MREGRRPNMRGVLVSCVMLAMLPVDLLSQGKPAATTAPATTPQVTTSTTDKTAQSAPEKPVYVSPFHATGPVARVDGEPISAETFNEDAHAWAQGIRGMLPTGQLNLYRDQLLEHAIDRHLFDRAMKKAAIELSDEELEEQWQAWLVREFPSPLARELFLKDPESDLAGLREELALQWRRQRFIVKRYKIEVTKAELAKFYASYGEGYTKPELVHARQILLSLPQDERGGGQEARGRGDALAGAPGQWGRDFRGVGEAALRRSERDPRWRHRLAQAPPDDGGLLQGRLRARGGRDLAARAHISGVAYHRSGRAIR